MSGNPLTSGVRVGFFGKLPSRGDFVGMGLSRPTTEAWDRWLTSVLPRAEPVLHELAEMCHAPSWRFAFGPGVCGPFAMAGLWRPSCDRVGRIFPLLVAAERAVASDVFLDAVETIAAEGVLGGMMPEMLLQRLNAAPRPEPANGADTTNARWWRKGNEMIVREAVLPDADAFVRMLRS